MGCGMEKFFCAFRTFWIARTNVGVLGEWGKVLGVDFFGFMLKNMFCGCWGAFARMRYGDFWGEGCGFLALAGWIGVIFRGLVGGGRGILLALCLHYCSQGEFLLFPGGIFTVPRGNFFS